MFAVRMILSLTFTIIMYKTLAFQTNCRTVNASVDRDGAEAIMLASLEKMEQQLSAGIDHIGRDVTLVVVPENFLTGAPVTETLVEWRDKAALEIDGRVYEAISGMVQRLQIYFSGNVFEIDPHFPDLYFKTSFIMGPNGDLMLRYRQLNSAYSPTPHDVWAYYLEAYGYDSIFPVVKTNIGTLACISGEDIAYPEVARCLTMRGAEVLLHSTADVASPQLTPRRVAKLARASENMAYVVSANAAGSTGGILPEQTYGGGSVVIDPRGQVLAEAGSGESLAAHADIDLNALRIQRQRTGQGNILARQRFELYAESYARHSVYPPNTLLSEVAERNHFARTQQAAIDKLKKEVF